MAKWSTGAQVIDGSRGTRRRRGWSKRCGGSRERASIGMPEVAIYEGAPNAFATGAFKNSALVAVSTGLLQSMNQEEVEAVLGHEIAHVANGDMVTLTLIQGVREHVRHLPRARRRHDRRPRGVPQRARHRARATTSPCSCCEIVFGILASIIVAWFSRQREFRADRGSARVPRLAAADGRTRCARLGGVEPGALPEAMRAFGITDRPGWMALFSTPPADRAADRGAAGARPLSSRCSGLLTAAARGRTPPRGSPTAASWRLDAGA